MLEVWFETTDFLGNSKSFVSVSYMVTTFSGAFYLLNSANNLFSFCSLFEDVFDFAIVDGYITLLSLYD